MTANETMFQGEGFDPRPARNDDLTAEACAPDDFSVDEVLRRLSPEEWFPTLRTDIPLWCF